MVLLVPEMEAWEMDTAVEGGRRFAAVKELWRSVEMGAAVEMGMAAVVEISSP